VIVVSIRGWSSAGLFLAAVMAAGRLNIPVGSLPEVRSDKTVVSLTLHAAVNSEGRDSFAYGGKNIAPVIRVFPGDTLKIDYENDLPVHSTESCAISPCKNMTNLHFHGLEVSPQSPQDNVIEMMAMPGETLHYAVQIPADHPPGLYWYHTHPHGESHRQALDGMSGALVIEGMERYVPEVRSLREQVLVVRGTSVEHAPDAAALLRRAGAEPPACSSGTGPVERVFTVNGEIRPAIGIDPGERQFWRIVNASADQYLDLQVDRQKLEIVALDGMPLAFHDPQHPKKFVEHALLPPAGRLEAIVTGPEAGSRVSLRTLCVDTGAKGDPNPAMVLADLRAGAPATSNGQRSKRKLPPPEYRSIDVSAFESSEPDFTVVFTEDEKGFYINDKKYEPEAAPMTHARAGTYQHWRILNSSAELHPMHIHQVHFLVFAEDGKRLENPVWLDTVNVPVGETVDVVMDFTNPVIKGMSLFHCHLLNHEDKGMMAKILFE
jgi:FtsP/CotA-like multicopper oxidase with cupredoxin domain